MAPYSGAQLVCRLGQWIAVPRLAHQWAPLWVDLSMVTPRAANHSGTSSVV